MENGVENANGDHRKEEMKSAAGEGDLKSESMDVGLNGKANGSAEESMESDVFEEAAMDRDSFDSSSFQDMASSFQDLQEMAFDAMDKSEGFDQKVVEKIEVFEGGEPLETIMFDDATENGVFGEEVGNDVYFADVATVVNSEEQTTEEKAENGVIDEEVQNDVGTVMKSEEQTTVEEDGPLEFNEEKAENVVIGEEVQSDVSFADVNAVVKSEEQTPVEEKDPMTVTEEKAESGVTGGVQYDVSLGDADTVLKPEEQTAVEENGLMELTEEKVDNGALKSMEQTVTEETSGNEKAENGSSCEVSFDASLESKEQDCTDERDVDADTANESKEQPPIDGVDQVISDAVGVDSHLGKKVLDAAKEFKAEAPLDEVGVDGGTGSKEQPVAEGIEHGVNGSLGLDSASENGHISHVQREFVKSHSVSETDNSITGRSYVGVVEELSDRTLVQAKTEGSSSGSKSEVREEFDRESVLVEDLSEPSSTDDSRRANSQPTPLAAAVSAPSASPGVPSLPSRPAGLGSSAPLLEPTSRPIQQPKVIGVPPQRQSQLAEAASSDESEENDETREKLQMIRVKFLRLAHRLGQTPHNVVVAQVLYRLGLAEQLRRNMNGPGVFSFDQASVMAEQLEASGKEPIDFSCTIMVIGKTGVGKTATINSIFDEVKLRTDAFQMATKKVQDIVGTVQGIKVRIIDTPGLFPSSSDQWRNEKILRSVKKFITQSPPDIVLYFDRLDMQSRDYGDVPLLRSITDVFGSSIWFNAIIVLTHAASAPPDGPNGTPLSYEMFVSQRSHVVQQAIRQAAQDLRLMNPVSLVENHCACRMNRAGQRVLPNGQVWKPHLLLLSFASKILAEANMLLQLHDAPPGRPFGGRTRAPPLPFFLSSLLQSRAPLKLPEDQFSDDFNGSEDLEASDSEGESEYDQLPPFRALNKSQLAKLSKAQNKAYFEELDYREKLLFRKQLKEERRRRRLMKKMAEEAKDLPIDYSNENAENENTGPASMPVSMPDLALPTSFDSDNPTHRYRFLDTSNQWIVRPVVENQVWDHDVGYDGLNVERLFAIKDKIPVSVSGQLTKDKKECTFQMELASSIKHGDVGATSLGLDLQTVGKDTAYTLRGETRIKNFRRNNTAAGVSVTHLGDAMSAGVKIEDNLELSKRIKLLMSGGAMAGRGDIAYGGRLEATLRDKDYPIGRALSTLALSVVDWHGDLAIGYNLQSQIPVGRGTIVVGNANVNNKGTGQVGIRLNSSDQLQIALFALLPLFRHVKRMLFGSSQLYD